MPDAKKKRKYIVPIVVAVIGAIAPIALLLRGGTSDAVTYAGRDSNDATSEMLSGVEVSVDARPVPRNARTDGSGLFSISVPGSDISNDVQIFFSKEGFEPVTKIVPPKGDQIFNVRLQPKAKASRQLQAEPPPGRAPTPRATGGSPGNVSAPPPPVLVNEGPRTAGGTAVLVVDARGQTDMAATRELAVALGATDSLFTQQFVDRVFHDVHQGNVDALRTLHLERFSTIALGVVSTRATPKTVQGASFIEAQARLDIRVVRPSLNFDARLVAAQANSTGFDEERVTRASVDKAVAQSINDLRPLF
jgi:hypothetical protein